MKKIKNINLNYRKWCTNIIRHTFRSLVPCIPKSNAHLALTITEDLIDTRGAIL